MAQQALTVITKILPGRQESLDILLMKLSVEMDSGPDLRLREMQTLHFACWSIQREEPGYASQLVFESSFDGGLDAHLDELIDKAGAAIDLVYAQCEGYPPEGAKIRSAVAAYLKLNSVKTPAFYIGCPGQSVGSIRNAIAVRKEIETFLDDPTNRAELKTLRPKQITDKIYRHLIGTEHAKPQKSAQTLDQEKSRAIFNIVLLVLSVLFIMWPLVPFIPLLRASQISWWIALIPNPILLLFLLWYTIALRGHEKRDASGPQPPPRPVDVRMFDKEDIYTQNHLTTMVIVKEGKFRLYTLKFVLWAISLLAKAVFITGQLGGIPTIHFARWILMDNDRRLLFFSNYDGSWASYLGDFVDKANYGLTAVWSNTEAFPDSKYLAWGGAQHIEQFKQWSREHNVFAAVWYSAYPNETIINLRNDLQIRDNIANITDDNAAKEFLQRL